MTGEERSTERMMEEEREGVNDWRRMARTGETEEKLIKWTKKRLIRRREKIGERNDFSFIFAFFAHKKR